MAAFINPTNATTMLFLFLLLSSILSSAFSAPAAAGHHAQQGLENRVRKLPVKNELQKSQEQNKEGIWRRARSSMARRMLIGSRAPICTFNECRGCLFKCTAEQVPVDANDPMNSAYHYKCVCHR